MKPQVPMAGLRNAEDVILDALVTCFTQCTDIKRYYRQAPDQPPMNEELPAMYFMVGGMLDPFGDGGEGSDIVNRNYVARLLISPWEAAALSEDNGNVNMIDGIQWMGIVREWIVNHPRLDIDNEDGSTYEGLPNMPYGAMISIRDSGLKPLPAPGSNKRYLGIDFELNIPVRIHFRTDQY